MISKATKCAKALLFSQKCENGNNYNYSTFLNTTQWEVGTKNNENRATLVLRYERTKLIKQRCSWCLFWPPVSQLASSQMVDPITTIREVDIQSHRGAALVELQMSRLQDMVPLSFFCPPLMKRCSAFSNASLELRGNRSTAKPVNCDP